MVSAEVFVVLMSLRLQCALVLVIVSTLGSIDDIGVEMITGQGQELNYP